MGYYTYYNLSIKNDDEVSIERQREASLYLLKDFGFSPITEKYHKERIEKSLYPFDWISDDSMKWYDYERDMINLSKEFPEVIFVLYGEGEEREDIWRSFFKNGKCVHQAAHIYYDPEPTF